MWLALSKQGLGAWLWRKPNPADLVVFLGDMSDRGRWYQTLKPWSESQAKWQALFPGVSVLRNSTQPLTRRPPTGSYPALVLPGNHDIGLPDPLTGAPVPNNALAASWFQQQYAPHVNDQFQLTDDHGTMSWDARIPISVNGTGVVSHELILLNGPALVGMETLDAPRWNSESSLAEAQSHAKSTSALIDWLGAHDTPDGAYALLMQYPAFSLRMYHSRVARPSDRAMYRGAQLYTASFVSRIVLLCRVVRFSRAVMWRARTKI